MRALLISLVALAAGVAVWFAATRGAPAPVASVGLEGPARLPDRRAEPPLHSDSDSGREDPALLAPTSAAPPSPAVSEAAAPTGPRALRGSVTDRFGAPVQNERVWLLPPNEAHPPATANLADYVTARTSSAGRFSLTLPAEGEWRLAVGPPGEPRTDPSPPRAFDGDASADVVVPGSAALSITFHALPETTDRLTLEVEVLAEPGEFRGRGRGGAQPRRGNGQAPDNGGNPRGGGARDEGGSDGGAFGPGRRGRRGNEEATLGVRLSPPTVAAMAAPMAQDPGEARGGEGGQRGGRRGYRGPGDSLDPNQRPNVPRPTPTQDGEATGPEDLEIGPPEEVWSSVAQHELTAAERTSGEVELHGLPGGEVGRLVLRSARTRFPGVTRFTLQADTLTRIEVFPVNLETSDSLAYKAVARPLGPTESPAGVRWTDE